MDTLRIHYITLYQSTLPSLAASRSPTQPHWPVHLDHCFARIILDNAVGVTKPWTQVLRAPAVRNMTQGQLERCVEVAEGIADGRVDLVEADRRSLALRGKGKGGKRKREGDVNGEAGEGEGEGEGGRYGEKRPEVAKLGKEEVEDVTPETDIVAPQSEEVKDGDIRSHFAAVPSGGPKDSDHAASENITGLPSPVSDLHSTPRSPARSPTKTITSESNSDELSEIHALISSAKHLTPLRRRVLTLLTQVPRGHYTTYGALASYVSSHPSPRSYTQTSSSKPSARSIGQAMRNNPFAPRVPCHRVLATGGKIGGFGGDWGEEGKHAGEKRRLLRSEGVRFDGKGIALGSPWTSFND